jgi:hypothetical protein
MPWQLEFFRMAVASEPSVPLVRVAHDCAVVAALAVVLAVAAGVPDLRLGVIQFSELAVIAVLGLGLAAVLTSSGRVTCDKFVWRLYWPFLILILCVFVFAFLPRDQILEVPPDSIGSLLRQPGWISFSRTIELLLTTSVFVIAANACVRSEQFLRLFACAYMWAVSVLAAYGILAFLFVISGLVDPSAATSDAQGLWRGAYFNGSLHEVRLRSFFVEGGPWGAYAVSGIVMTLYRRYALRAITANAARIHVLIVTVSILLADSKSGIALAIFLAVAYWFGNRVGLRALLQAGVIGGVLLAGAIALGVVAGMYTYARTAWNLENSPQRFSEFTTASRIGAVFILPRMVEAHPIIGVGIGNYPLARNDPQYRGFLPVVPIWDGTGLGMIGYVGELGVPLVVAYGCLLLRLAWLVRRRRLGRWPFVLAIYPFMVQFLAIQITYFYPWLVFAMACGAVVRAEKARATGQIEASAVVAEGA